MSSQGGLSRQGVSLGVAPAEVFVWLRFFGIGLYLVGGWPTWLMVINGGEWWLIIWLMMVNDD